MDFKKKNYNLLPHLGQIPDVLSTRIWHLGQINATRFFSLDFDLKKLVIYLLKLNNKHDIITTLVKITTATGFESG